MTTTNNRIEQLSEVANRILATAWGAQASDDERMDGLINHLVTYNLDIDLLYRLDSILATMELHERVNGPINRLLACKTDKALLALNDFYKAYADGEIEEELQYLGICYIDLLESHDVIYYAPSTWYNLADEDLKENGIKANALYWLDDINYSWEWQVLNGAANGFDNYDSLHDILMYYCDTEIYTALDNAIIDANGELFTAINESMQLVLKDSQGNTVKSFMHFGAYKIGFETREFTSVESFDDLVDYIIGGNK